jgi:hypothetical protein
MELRMYETKGDVETYRDKLLIIIDLAGQTIHASLKYTMGKYLQATNGILRNETREESEWELEAVANLLSKNNPAERLLGLPRLIVIYIPPCRYVP